MRSVVGDQRIRSDLRPARGARSLAGPERWLAGTVELMAHHLDDASTRGPQGRSTRQKRALAAALAASDAFRSAQELHSELRANGANVGLTTVYNQLRALADSGEVDVLRSDEGECLYRRCATEDHHHHLVCRRCGRTVEVEGPEVEDWAKRIAAKNQFTEISHTVEIFGTCSACSARSDREDRQISVI